MEYCRICKQTGDFSVCDICGGCELKCCKNLLTYCLDQQEKLTICLGENCYIILRIK